MKERKYYLKIWQELSEEKNMIFLAGPRQSGKTTLATIISKAFTNSSYFNWDIHDHRIRFFENPIFFIEIDRKDQSIPIIIFDEIHKYKDWKNYLKGVYDQFHSSFKFLVSGSGRLNIYQRGSDSLAGRYFLFHLWPFTIGELAEMNTTIEVFLENPLDITIVENRRLKTIWDSLMILSGFPEPFLANRETTYRRWSSTYSSQLIREDIRDLSGVKSIPEIETLYILLPSKVGAPLSVSSLARDLKVSYNSIQNWLSIFEKFFLIFSISPWTKMISRAIHKERKIYLWDIPKIKNPAAKFENMVALELFRAVTSWNDLGYGSFSLHYIKNKEHQEVDFIIANNNEPIFLIEAKLTDTKPSPILRKFQNIYKIPSIQLTNEGDSFRIYPNNSQKILVAPAYQWLSRLP